MIFGHLFYSDYLDVGWQKVSELFGSKVSGDNCTAMKKREKREKETTYCSSNETKTLHKRFGDKKSSCFRIIL
jgi:hypothetical protein